MANWSGTAKPGKTKGVRACEFIFTELFFFILFIILFISGSRHNLFPKYCEDWLIISLLAFSNNLIISDKAKVRHTK